jgi:hypothetical protein
MTIPAAVLAAILFLAMAAFQASLGRILADRRIAPASTPSRSATSIAVRNMRGA